MKPANHTIRVLLWILFLGILSVGTRPSSAWALDKVGDLPLLSYDLGQPKQDVEKTLTTHKEVPQDDETLAVEVKLPTGWIRYQDNVKFLVTPDGEKEDRKNETDIFGTLVKFISPPRLEYRSEFRIRSIELNSLMSLKDWFHLYTLQMGITPEGAAMVTDNRLDAQYTLFEDGEPTVVRAVIQRSGKKILLAEYLLHQDNYEAERDQQVTAMADYHLISPDLDLPIALNVYAFVDIAKFNYPNNWILYTPDLDTIDRMDASVINVKGMLPTDHRRNLQDLQLNGRIDISMVSRFIGTSIENEVGNIGRDLQDKGLVLGDKIESFENFPVHKLVKSITVDVYHIKPPASAKVKYSQFSGRNLTQKKLADYEYWIAVLETQSRYYFVRLLTIGRDEDYKAWAENTGAFRALVNSMSPVNDSAR